jgi:predicted naringenin-chalcone synthase
MHLNRIAHYVPQHKYAQSDVLQIMKSVLALDDKQQRILDIIYRKSAIEYRHSVVGDIDPTFEGDRLFFDTDGALLPTPHTGTRNEWYRKAASEGYVALARTILDEHQMPAEEVTHVITVSCTGFYAPGPDYDIVTQLGMQPQTQRYHLGFMGCYAAFPALRMADAILAKEPQAKVMVICLELCTIHLQFTSGPDELLAASLFADGAAGTLCTSEPLHDDALAWKHSHSTLIGEGEADMAWTIGHQGFDMKLSSYVPKLLEKHGEDVLAKAFPEGLPDFSIYALHPGGAAIVDKMQHLLGQPDASMQYSRNVLRNFGNMSSATILFVLQQVQSQLQSGESTLAMGFGPGLTVESALLQKV